MRYTVTKYNCALLATAHDYIFIHTSELKKYQAENTQLEMKMMR